MNETFKERMDRLRENWVFRAIEATQGTKLGAIFLAMIEKQRRTRPQFRGKATITSDGFVMCDFIDRHNVLHLGALVCTVEELVANLRGLAEHLRLNDDEAQAMFQKAREWIAVDYRMGNDNMRHDFKPTIKPWV